MAEKPRKDKKKKTRRRKVRRDADISSSSSSSEDESPVASKVPSVEQSTSDVEMAEDQVIQESPEATSESQPKSKTVSEEDFNSWYIRQVAKELEEDLDKVRSASDFKDSSLPVLITALQQGASLFSKEEKTRILGGS